MARKPTKMTLCWRCAHACGNCDWSAEGTPVKGWTAKETQVRNPDGNGRYRTSRSYMIIKCPNFIDDTARYNQRYPPSRNNNWHPNPVAREVMNKHIEYPEKVVNIYKSDARKRVEALPTSELINRIETRLEGVEQDIAKLTFIGKMRACDVAEIVFYTNVHVNRILRDICRKLDS